MKEDDYISLLYKKLSKSITPSEMERLDVWLTSSEENREIANSVEMSWNMGSGYNDPIVVDLDEDYAELEQRMEEDEDELEMTESTPVRSLPRRNWWSVAASFLILVSIGYLLRNNFRSANEWEEVTAVTTMDEALVLSDGTKVWLSENSTILRPGNFSVKERRVRLKGQAYFEVTPEANRPFVIQTESGEVKVLGTSFNVRDFLSEGEMRVEVLTGRVEVETRDESQKIYLEANEKGVLNKKNRTFVKQKNTSENFLYWHTGKLSFKEKVLEEVLAELEKQFEIKVQLLDASLVSCPFTSTFDQPKVEDIIATIGGVYGMEIIQKSKNNYQLKGGSCQ